MAPSENEFDAPGLEGSAWQPAAGLLGRTEKSVQGHKMQGPEELGTLQAGVEMGLD